MISSIITTNPSGIFSKYSIANYNYTKDGLIDNIITQQNNKKESLVDFSYEFY
jgi:hypothetical protein